ncbi:hypothetical protein PRIPAC_97463 [Pristionchus pacificus]|uniref:Uncharacterized protein n=1 Tax=Pristionchus pacificus TaxID=54126 RepID=A0A2A6CUL0_PRIPA|nr:hypothetical protein PRIPAC_97463 [Pristionchus pacificus]|eukprot:PDM81776.1 hypothetical protein PRIPAC_37618 [Pristionchus pacificus]
MLSLRKSLFLVLLFNLITCHKHLLPKELMLVKEKGIDAILEEGEVITPVRFTLKFDGLNDIEDTMRSVYEQTCQTVSSPSSTVRGGRFERGIDWVETAGVAAIGIVSTIFYPVGAGIGAALGTMNAMKIADLDYKMRRIYALHMADKFAAELDRAFVSHELSGIVLAGLSKVSEQKGTGPRITTTSRITVKDESEYFAHSPKKAKSNFQNRKRKAILNRRRKTAKKDKKYVQIEESVPLRTPSWWKKSSQFNFLHSYSIYTPTFSNPLPPHPFIIYSDDNANYGVIVSIDDLDITIISSSPDAERLGYLAAFTSAGAREERVSVRVLPTQTTESQNEKLPLLLILLLAYKTDSSDLRTVKFNIPSHPIINLIVKASSKRIPCSPHNAISKKTYTLHCACARPSHKEEMGFMIPRLVKCQKCGWKYADCELGPIPESSKLKWTCTDCISFWNVPKWGGIETTPEGDKIIHNTCALDSFLATLISQHRLDPRLFEKIGTASLFEKYLRSMLMDGNIDQVKDELIKKILSNKIDKKGRYDMWASECEILDRLFEYSSKLLFNLKYRTCSERKKLTRCHFETQKKGDSMKQVVYDSILGQSDCQSCQGSRQIPNVTSTAWFIPVDISLEKESPSRCDELPKEIKI